MSWVFDVARGWVWPNRGIGSPRLRIGIAQALCHRADFLILDLDICLLDAVGKRAVAQVGDLLAWRKLNVWQSALPRQQR